MNSLEEGEVEDSTTAATLPPLLPPPPAFNSLPPKPATNTNTAINSLSRPPLPPPSSSLSNWNRSHTHSPQKAATIYLSPDRNRRTHSRSRSRSPQLNRSRNRGSSSTNSYSQTQSNHPRSSSHSPSRTPTKRQRIYRGKLYAQQQKLEQGSSSNRNIDGNLDHPGRSESEEEEDDDHVDCETTTKKDDGGVHSQKSRVKAGMVVALKRIIVHNELDGLPITALREIRILKSLDHPNIVPVIDISYSKGNLKLLKRGNTYMVFPYIDHDLAGLIENKSITFNVSQIKLYSKQLLLGTAYLHRNKILHRDLKAANLAQHNNKKREYTNCVVTRWYRPPEILLGNRRYGTAACGSPTAKSMPGWESLPGCEGVRSWANKPRRVKEEYERSSPELADLLDHLLVLDHSRRLTAEEALDHDWFWTDPMAIDPAKLPHTNHHMNMIDAGKQEQAKRTHQHQLASFTEIQAVLHL
ncbi:hypothetical protein KEM48_002303 [Puccinia striiformis f. sp. tritici PST-130]|nr:hypothetical protein KEM48_002303 [Puccinia striiformis f. sp. tritici PST-130]